MISERYVNDGKSLMELNDTQKKARDEVIGKIVSNEYTYEEYCCECGQTIEQMELIAEKDRYGIPVETRICKNCGLVMTNPRMTQESYNEFYDKEYRRLYVGDEQPQKEFFDKQVRKGQLIFDYLSKNLDISGIKTILEIGTGAGGILYAIQKEMAPDVVIEGIDLGSEYIEYGRNYGLNLKCMDSAELCRIKPHQYDLIILSHVYEHFLDLKKEMDSISSLLRKGGYLYIEVPGIYNIHNAYKGDFLLFLQNAHIRHFTLASLKCVLKRYGYDLVCGNEYIRSVYTMEDDESDALTETSQDRYAETIEYLYRIENKLAEKSAGLHDIR